MRADAQPSAEESIRYALGLRTWAIVGCSPDPARDSHRIAALLLDNGYRVLPVNPRADEVLGLPCAPSLGDLASREQVDVVDLFRRSEAVGQHVEEAIAIRAKAVWMQLAVVDEAAAERARAAGLRVVMDRCPAIELPRLGVPGRDV
jgi:predicted CoA-binding protein